MRSHSHKNRCRDDSRTRGFTIIEMVLYIVLLSGILTMIIPYIYATNEQNLKLIGEIGSPA